MQSQPQYKFYATLLDSFLWYKRSESEFAEQEFINRINRVQETDAEKIWTMGRGTALNNLIDSIILNGYDKLGEDVTIFDSYDFPTYLVNTLVDTLTGSACQIYTSITIKVNGVDVLLYGYIDYILLNKCIDLKTTKEYALGKYKDSMQMHLYPVCLANKNIDVDTFEFVAVEFSSRGANIYSESYPVNIAQSTSHLISVCEELIAFIEAKKHLITDVKIFGLDETTNYIATPIDEGMIIDKL